MRRSHWKLLVLVAFVFLAEGFAEISAEDWPMLGRNNTRNAVSPEKNPPTFWHVERKNKKGEITRPEKNIKWKAEIGVYCFSTPVVSDGLIWVGTTKDRDFSKSQDRALKCFRESDGKFLYQYISPRLPDRVNNSEIGGICCSPLIEGDLLWFTTNRCETICLNIAPLKKGKGDPKVVWKFDMREKLGVFPRALLMGPGRTCSIASYKDWIYVVTGNGTDYSGKIPSPDAPSLVCFNKHTGKVVWTDNSSGKNLLMGEWSSPLVVEIDGRCQVIVPQGDGWIRSFDAQSGEKIWWFDINKKTWKYGSTGRGKRNYFLSTPVLCENRVYIAGGQYVEHGEGPGRLVCINPMKKGDISSELAVDKNGKPLPQRRFQAVDTDKGEKAIANPNSGLDWEYTKVGKYYEDAMHRTIANVVADKGLVIVPDFSGIVHCLDAKTGKRHWSADMLAEIWGTPLIVDDKIYVIDEDGDVAIFPLSADPRQAVKKETDKNGVFFLPITEFESWIYSYGSPSPIFANGVLYLATKRTLFAIQEKTKPTK